jgi:hypothetical protein
MYADDISRFVTVRARYKLCLYTTVLVGKDKIFTVYEHGFFSWTRNWFLSGGFFSALWRKFQALRPNSTKERRAPPTKIPIRKQNAIIKLTKRIQGVTCREK